MHYTPSLRKLEQLGGKELLPRAKAITELTVEDVSDALARGVTAESIAETFIQRSNDLNPRLNAIITWNPLALDDARKVDSLLASKKNLGPLAGVPVVIKDTMDMIGLPTTAGWHFFSSKAGGKDLIPERDAPVVARMREAGCVILGKTNVPILSASGTDANDSWAGPTLNSASPEHVPGGSTAGTATAVGSTMAVLGLAEETAGSIQNPASAQGLVGIKPTFGLVPNAGVVPLSGSARDVVGPIARTVRDAALTLDAIAGYSSEDPKTLAAVGKLPEGGYTSLFSTLTLSGAKVGLYGPGWRDEELSPECSKLYESSQSELVSCGALLIEDPFKDSDLSSLRKPVEGCAWDPRGMESLAYDLELYLNRLGPSAAVTDFKGFAELTKAEDPLRSGGMLDYLNSLPETKISLDNPRVPPPLKDFIKIKELYLHKIEKIFSEHSVDVLVYPQMTAEPPKLSENEPINPTTVSEVNIAGIPAVTVPAGRYASGAPFNLVFVGLAWSEAKILALAHDFEQKTHHRMKLAQQSRK